MRARIKGTSGAFQDIRNICLKDWNVLDIDDVEFEQPTSDNWQDVRERAAIAAMQGVMNFFGSIDYNKETIAKLAVEQADALVKKLKEKQYEKENSKQILQSNKERQKKCQAEKKNR